MSEMPNCPRCEGQEFIAIPDSLASSCKTCGFVWVNTGDGYIKGATIGQWLEDVFDIPNTIDPQWDKK